MGFCWHLPENVFHRLRPQMETVQLSRKQIIYHADDPLEKLHFMERGLISLIKTMQHSRTVRAGAVPHGDCREQGRAKPNRAIYALHRSMNPPKLQHATACIQLKSAAVAGCS